MSLPTIDDVRAAAERIAPHVHKTPVLTSRALDDLCGRELFFKCENFQRAGAFKFRGATNTVFSLTDAEAARGVATHSSGNHGAALALAARLRGIDAHIVMPTSSVAVKKVAVETYGGIITPCAPTLIARETTLDQVVARTGATFVHPYNDARVIAGQGTAALELIDAVPDLDLIMTPVGGGGLLSGSSLAARAARIPIIAAEPSGADDAYRSFKAGELIPQQNPDTIADGLLTSLGEITFALIQQNVADVIPVDDTGIIAAMRHIWQRMKIIVEPSSSVPLAVLLDTDAGRNLTAKRVGIILSGGNVDLDHLPWS